MISDQIRVTARACANEKKKRSRSRENATECFFPCHFSRTLSNRIFNCIPYRKATAKCTRNHRRYDYVTISFATTLFSCETSMKIVYNEVVNNRVKAMTLEEQFASLNIHAIDSHLRTGILELMTHDVFPSCKEETHRIPVLFGRPSRARKKLASHSVFLGHQVWAMSYIFSLALDSTRRNEQTVLRAGYVIGPKVNDWTKSYGNDLACWFNL